MTIVQAILLCLLLACFIKIPIPSSGRQVFDVLAYLIVIAFVLFVLLHR